MYDGYRVSFRGVQWQGRSFKHPTTSTAEVKDIVQLYCYSTYVFMANYRVKFILFYFSEHN